ncbi:LiaF transmembrane domain-containing protein [Lacticaseibacillus hegangensis]|uniref:LiaF transmembrane domain-containing protein n=1 Tax=Lacticaseibacillus hegangensis TaxID=2486010 RepID=A0ABW4CV47_9LACO|nr:hypothetical protein [Lacticaseibacillus hegangensis]
METKQVKWGHWFWGLFFVVCAGILVLSQLGLFTYHLHFWTLVLVLILVAAAIKSLASLSFAGFSFSLAFLAMLFAKPLGIQQLVPWTVLGAALLLSIGLTLLFKPLKKHHFSVVTINDKHYTISELRQLQKEAKQAPSYVPSSESADVTVNVKLGSATRYVQQGDFRHAVIRTNLGDVKVFFDKATIINEPALIEVLGQMGDISLYIPRDWNVQPNLGNFAVDFTEKGETPTKTGPLVVLAGDFKMGDVTIHYI